jgi:hypothetical protein
MHYIKQARLAISSNGASGAFSTGPASGYILNFLFMFVVFVASTICHARVMIYLEFRIKINYNLALIPTHAGMFDTLANRSRTRDRIAIVQT